MPVSLTNRNSLRLSVQILPNACWQVMLTRIVFASGAPHPFLYHLLTLMSLVRNNSWAASAKAAICMPFQASITIKIIPPVLASTSSGWSGRRSVPVLYASFPVVSTKILYKLESWPLASLHWNWPDAGRISLWVWPGIGSAYYTIKTTERDKG